MKNILVVFTLLCFLSCNSKKNDETESKAVMQSKFDTQQSNYQSSVNKEYKKAIERKQLFKQFLKKFKRVSLPYKYRLTSNTERINFSGMANLNKDSADTLFVKTEYFDETYCFGLLSDTSNFYSIIYFFPADDYYPVLATYSKSGDFISQEPLTVSGCGSDCGLTFCSQTVLIDKNLLIRSADSVRYDYQCNDEGNIMEDSGLLYALSKTGQINKIGQIEMGKEVRSEKKLPTTKPKKH